MKHRVKLQRNPNPAFARVAKIITKGPPPEYVDKAKDRLDAALGQMGERMDEEAEKEAA
jgi:hypothetical protein